MNYLTTFQRQNKYLRSAAVNYALTYGLKPNPKYRYLPLINDSSGDCANFISQCLLAGGAQMDFNAVRPWWYRHATNRSQDTWAISWTVAHSLYYYLRVNAEKNSAYIKGLEVTNRRDLELGDLIFFEDNRGRIFHSAIVSGFSLGEPLITHHSFEAVNIPYRSSWPAFKYHYIKVAL
jgi:hypothetical protein